jgi:hypothetical protein
MEWDISSLTINPTVYLYANTNSVAELRIPYNHYQSYLDTGKMLSQPSIRNTLGYVVVYVIEPLLGVNITKATVSIFSFMENNQFKVPRVSSAIETSLVAESGLLTSALSSLLSVGQSILDPIVGDLGSAAKSKMSKVAKEGAKSVIDKMAAKALPSNFVGDAIDLSGGLLDGALAFLGLDNPTIPTEESRMIVKANGSMNYSIGPEFIEKMAVVPSSMSLVSPESFATVVDEMDTSYLYRKYSYMGSFTFNSTAGPSALLYQIPLSPTPTLHKAFAGEIIQSHAWLPLLSYLGLPYRFWTGGLKYKFLVSSSSLQTCKLFVAFNYGPNLPTSVIDAATQYGTVIEINQGSNEFEFSVPYISTTPYKYVSTGSDSEASSMGTLSVIVLNPLVSPTAVVDSMSVAVFICGSDDFSYEFLAAANPAFPVWGANVAPPSNVCNEGHNRLWLFGQNRCDGPVRVAESGLLISSTVAPTNVDATVTDIATGEQGDKDIQVAPPQLDTTVDDHFGVVGVSLRNLAKKYQYIGQLTFNNIFPETQPVFPWLTSSINIPYDLYGLGQMVPITGYATKVPSANAGLLSWMAAMYRQVKGGWRFKVVINTSGVDPAVQLPVHHIVTYVYWLPAGNNRVTNTAIDTTAETVSMYPLDIGTSYVGLGNPVTGYVPTPKSYRLAVLNGNTSNVLEFEVPYASIYSSLKVPTGATETYGPLFNSGKLYFYTSMPKGWKVSASLYAAFADETRFGTLYRIPLTWAPGVFQIQGAALKVIDNIGMGSYAIPAFVDDGFVMVDEKDPSAKDDSLAEGDVVVATSPELVPELKSAVGVVAPPVETTKRIDPSRPREPSVIERVRRFINRNRSASAQDLNSFIRGITTGGNPGAIIRSSGLKIDRTGHYYMTSGFMSRKRNNRRPVGLNTS